MTAAAPILRAEAITKRFGARWALDRIDFSLAAGETVALFGPNGAGKTTLLQVFASLLRPTSGRLTLFGRDPRRQDWPRERIGYLSHRSFLYPNLTGAENLAFFGRLYRLPDLADRIAQRAAEVGLADRIGDRVGTYSRGMEQRLSIARALLHDPVLLLLDEPFSGVDPVGAGHLSDRFARFRSAGRSLLIATHQLETGYRLADRLIIVVDGRLVFQADRKEISFEDFRACYREQVEPGGTARNCA